MSAHASVLPNSTIVRSFPWTVRLAGGALRLLGAVAPEAAARRAADLFLTPPRPAAPERERGWLAGAHREMALSGGRELAVWIWPGATVRPRTVVLAHGWGGRGSQLGAFVAPLRAEGARVVAFDAPAHGGSAGRKTNLIQFSEAVAAILERYAEQGPVDGIIAHSFGAAATTIALARGSAVGRAVFVAPAEDYDQFTGIFRRALGLDRALVERMQRSIEQRIGVEWSAVRGRILAPRLHQPLLVVHDEGDLEVPISHGETLASFWPQAQLRRTQGLGHRRILRDADIIGEATAHLLG